MGKATPGFDMSVSVGWPLHSKTSFSSHLQPLFFQQFYIWADISTTIFVIAVSVLVCKGFMQTYFFIVIHGYDAYSVLAMYFICA